MIAIDTLLQERQAQGKPIRVGLIGAGFMAKGIVNQILNSVPGMELVAVSNRNPERAIPCLHPDISVLPARGSPQPQRMEQRHFPGPHSQT